MVAAFGSPESDGRLDAAQALGVTEAAVIHWIKNGIPAARFATIVSKLGTDRVSLEQLHAMKIQKEA